MTESPRGRVRRPSEKVQAMLEEHHLEKQGAEQKAQEKAKRRDALSRKREQASKAAEPGLLLSSTVQVQGRTDTPRRQPLPADNAFTSKSVATARHVVPTSSLTARKGNVPPIPANNAKVRRCY
ncbi:hypothetical protein JVT61DRAFT_5900 [Boletus reticuloceps]|uniref:Uncharacterized protein n=1 Tax=Boletus reticuloceps TaxID=495285 RepID=A0A8I3A870_9AGAM|nr:hypothetical protein JVT61DRAFT_5900 [Boletus reticuloceps]